MKKMFNKMSNTMKTVTCKAHCAMTCARARLSDPLCNTCGEGYIDTAIKILSPWCWAPCSCWPLHSVRGHRPAHRDRARRGNV